MEAKMADISGKITRKSLKAKKKAGEYMFQVTNDDLGMAYRRLCDLIDALSGRM